MGSCAAPSAKGDDKFITTDYLQQCHLSLHHKIMNDRSMAVLFSYARQGMEGDRAGLNRPPAANRRKPQR
ncbi:hypothetical protein C2D59_28810 (plasmid) [Klebsiella pneumoniae]|uniref:DNA replication protein n=3 Tax=Enterobacterales TaxID=91347 RepID=A0A3S6QDI5_KLEPN|nr:hypothetical protein [Klebsiella pneumoniae]AUG89373.1 hypothetical protein CN886_0094 [Klebsiella pneumoniae]QFY36916.1 hypothetical protein C2D59_28810 [Klebsiella pneumoniae]